MTTAVDINDIIINTYCNILSPIIMASIVSDKSMKNVKGLPVKKGLDGNGLRIVIINTRWNELVIKALVKGCKKRLLELNVDIAHILHMEVPGSYELPYAASRVARQANIDAIICIGCLIKGETMHFEYICEAVTQGIMKIQLNSGVRS